jgi:predicted small lipoprotein YifL
MSLRVVWHVRLPLLLGSVLLIAACGMKGDLYLEPDEDKKEDQAWIIQSANDRA